MKFLRFSAVLMLVFGAFFNTAFAAPIEIELTIDPVMCNSYNESGQCLDYAYGTQKLYVEGDNVYYVNDDDERVFLTPGPNGATIDAPNRYFEVTFKQNCPVNQGAPDITKFAKWAFLGYYKDTGCGEDGANCTPYINGDFDDTSADRITDEGLAAARGYNANAEWFGLWREDERYGHFVTFPTTDGENPDVSCPGYTFDGWFDANNTRVEYNTDTDSDGVFDGYVPNPERSETLYAKWNQVGGCPCTQVGFDYNGGELGDGASQVALYVNDNGFFTDSSCETPVGVNTTLQASKKGEKCKASGYKIQDGPDSYVTDETFKIIVPEAVQNHLAPCPKSVTLVADYKNCPYRIICKDPVNNNAYYDLVTSDEDVAGYGETIQITKQTLEKQCSLECEKPFNQNGWEVWADGALQDPSPVGLPLNIIYGTAYNGALVIEFKPHCVVYSVKYKCAINAPEPIITQQIDTKQIYTVLDFEDSGCVLPEGAVFNGWKLSLPGTDLDGKVYSKNETSFIDNWPDADGTFTAQYTCDTDYENTGTEDNPVCSPKATPGYTATFNCYYVSPPENSSIFINPDTEGFSPRYGTAENNYTITAPDPAQCVVNPSLPLCGRVAGGFWTPRAKKWFGSYHAGDEITLSNNLTVDVSEYGSHSSIISYDCGFGTNSGGHTNPTSISVKFKNCNNVIVANPDDCNPGSDLTFAGWRVGDTGVVLSQANGNLDSNWKYINDEDYISNNINYGNDNVWRFGGQTLTAQWVCNDSNKVFVDGECVETEPETMYLACADGAEPISITATAGDSVNQLFSTAFTENCVNYEYCQNSGNFVPTGIHVTSSTGTLPDVLSAAVDENGMLSEDFLNSNQSLTYDSTWNNVTWTIVGVCKYDATYECGDHATPSDDGTGGGDATKSGVSHTEKITGGGAYTVRNFAESDCVVETGYVFDGWKSDYPNSNTVYGRNETSVISSYPSRGITFTAQYTCDTDYENTGTDENPVCAPKSGDGDMVTIQLYIDDVSCLRDTNNECIDGEYNYGTKEIYVDKLAGRVYFIRGGGEQDMTPDNHATSAGITPPERYHVVKFDINCPGQNNPGDKFAKWAFMGYYKDQNSPSESNASALANQDPLPDTYIKGDSSARWGDFKDHITQKGYTAALSYNSATTWYGKWSNGYSPVTFPTVTCPGKVFVGWFKGPEDNAERAIYTREKNENGTLDFGYFPTSEEILYAHWQNENNATLSCVGATEGATPFTLVQNGELQFTPTNEADFMQLCCGSEMSCCPEGYEFDITSNGYNKWLIDIPDAVPTEVNWDSMYIAGIGNYNNGYGEFFNEPDEFYPNGGTIVPVCVQIPQCHKIVFDNVYNTLAHVNANVNLYIKRTKVNGNDDGVEYENRWYSDSECTEEVNPNTRVSAPVYDTYNFEGYYYEDDNRQIFTNQTDNGKLLLNNATTGAEDWDITNLTSPITLKAHWTTISVTGQCLPNSDTTFVIEGWTNLGSGDAAFKECVCPGTNNQPDSIAGWHILGSVPPELQSIYTTNDNILPISFFTSENYSQYAQYLDGLTLYLELICNYDVTYVCGNKQHTYNDDAITGQPYSVKTFDDVNNAITGGCQTFDNAHFIGWKFNNTVYSFDNNTPVVPSWSSGNGTFTAQYTCDTDYENTGTEDNLVCAPKATGHTAEFYCEPNSSIKNNIRCIKDFAMDADVSNYYVVAEQEPRIQQDISYNDIIILEHLTDTCYLTGLTDIEKRWVGSVTAPNKWSYNLGNGITSVLEDSQFTYTYDGDTLRFDANYSSGTFGVDFCCSQSDCTNENFIERENISACETSLRTPLASVCARPTNATVFKHWREENTSSDPNECWNTYNDFSYTSSSDHTTLEIGADTLFTTKITLNGTCKPSSHRFVAVWDCEDGYEYDINSGQCVQDISVTYMCYAGDTNLEHHKSDPVDATSYTVKKFVSGLANFPNMCDINSTQLEKWYFSGDNALYAPNTTINDWSYGNDQTFVPGYTATFECGSCFGNGNMRQEVRVPLGGSISLPSVSSVCGTSINSECTGAVDVNLGWKVEYPTGIGSSPISNANCSARTEDVNGNTFGWNCPTDLTFKPIGDFHNNPVTYELCCPTYSTICHTYTGNGGSVENYATGPQFQAFLAQHCPTSPCQNDGEAAWLGWYVSGDLPQNIQNDMINNPLQIPALMLPYNYSGFSNINFDSHYNVQIRAITACFYDVTYECANLGGNTTRVDSYDSTWRFDPTAAEWPGGAAVRRGYWGHLGGAPYVTRDISWAGCNPQSGYIFNGWDFSTEQTEPFQPANNNHFVPASSPYNAGDERPWPSYSFTGDNNLGESSTRHEGYPGTFTAQWKWGSGTDQCHKVTFVLNSGSWPMDANWPAGVTNQTLYKRSGDARWYSASDCNDNSLINNPVTPVPTRNNNDFNGFAPYGGSPIIFGSDGQLTVEDGQNWTIVADTALYAQWEQCTDMAFYDTETGQCVSCAEGEYWDASAEECKNCNQEIKTYGPPYSLYNWTSRPPYNWSIKQCYRLCDNVQCTMADTTQVFSVQFLDNPGRQVSFYGNERADINVCDSNQGVSYCPLVGSSIVFGTYDDYEGLKTNANKVNFHGGTDGETNLGMLYIIGNRHPAQGGQAYGWSQIVGPAQVRGDDVSRNVRIIYPIDKAPEATPVSGMDFAGYGYPQGNETQYIDAGRNLTIDNAARILSGVNVNQSDARDLYAMYSSKPDFVINLLYDYGDGDPNHYESPDVPTAYNKLYTTQNVGVYRDAARTQQMTTNGNNIEVTRKYVTVTLDANGGTVNGWNGQSGEIVESDFYMDFSGFFNAAAGIKQYITPQGFITTAGIDAGKAYTSDANWYARWRGVSVPLPIPTHDGYGFDGWYGQNWSAPAGPSINPNDDIELTARWTKCNENEIVINGQCVSCTCDEGDGVLEDSCTTSVSGNSCNATAQCENNYGGLHASCNGENCMVSCSPCDAGLNQISINSQCVTCNCTPGTGAHCGDFSASNNQCNWGMGCNEGYVHLMPNCSGQGNSNCTPTCEPCQPGYISQNNECVPCEPESYQNGNECKPCPDGQTSGEGATECYPITSHAIYVCGTGIGAGYSTSVNYGDTHTIMTNAVVGCYRDNSTFAGWAFNGDNTIYFDNVGATVRWNYTDDKTFTAKWCSNCSVVEHGTNLLTIPEPGYCSCDLTCDTGYHVENGTCEPNVYPNENGITYLPNGGTPNEDFTQTVTFDAEFTTLGAVYSKARNVLDWWNVVSGGAGTFDGRAELNTTYTYQTDGSTTLEAKWTPCNPGYISQNNECVPCGENTYQTDDNCEPCPVGQTSDAGATECEPVKTYARYTCGNGASGAAPADELMSYGASHTVKQNNGNAGERGCWKENNIFVGWIFGANNVFYEPGNTVAWNYTTDQTFAARYCPECPAIDHGTNQFSFESGQCHCTQVCDYGYEPVGGICKPKTNLVLTYKSNGGVPNQTFQRIYAFDQSFTTLGFADVRYVKSESIMTHWELESDVGRETFNGGVAEFNTNYTYRTDGNINLLAHWEPCSCAYGVGVALCNRPSIVNNACNFTAECEPGYIKPLVECNGASCVAQCKQCPAGTISVENECVSCKCEPKPDGGAASCGTLSIENNTCGWGPTCRPGYHNPISNCTGTGNIDCKPYCEMCGEGTYGTDGLSCTACPDGYTAPAGSTSIEDCYSHPIQYTINYQSNNGLHQTYNQNVYYNDAFTTATKTGTGFTRAGYVIDHWDVVSGGTNTFTDYDSDSHLYYANPGRNYAHYIDVVNTTLRAKWKICPEGTYEFGDVCRDCPDNYTSYEGAASIDECFLYHCDDGYHIEHGECVDNEKACVVPNAPNATGGKRFWNDELKAYGPCITVECDYGYHISGNACVKNNETCTVTNGHGEHMWDESTNQWGTCYVTNCDPGYYESGNACVECENRRVNGEIAVSGYVYGCEIATCMYQGQKYTLEGNECVPICTSDRFNEDPNNPTGTIRWDDNTKRCIRTCNPGYKMW